jgi:D-tyrosyl-tRNA(Tyr) deacylase
MSNNPNDYEPPRFYAEIGQDGSYWIHDRDTADWQQGPFAYIDEALEHARELNRIFKR